MACHREDTRVSQRSKVHHCGERYNLQNWVIWPTEDKFFFNVQSLRGSWEFRGSTYQQIRAPAIGMAEELIPHFSAAWNDPEKPQAGFKYLYLTPAMKERFEDGKSRGVYNRKKSQSMANYDTRSPLSSVKRTV